MASAGLILGGIIFIILGIIFFIIGIYYLRKEFKDYDAQTATPFSSKTTTGWALFICGVVSFFIGVILLMLGSRSSKVNVRTNPSRTNPSSLMSEMLASAIIL